MLIKTRDVPQADVLEDILRAVETVSAGTTSYQGISTAIGKVGRQGRYYRRAAEILGFIRPTGSNRSALTPAGERLVAVGKQEGRMLLAEAVLGSPLIHRMLPFLEARSRDGCSRDELERFIADVTEATGATTMIPRRTATVVSWLQSIGMLVEDSNRYHLQALPVGIGVVEFASDEEPLLPVRYELREYEEVARRASAAKASIKYAVDDALRERASRAHEQLTGVLAAKIREHGAVPRRNRMIDLAAHVGGNYYLFEVKSTRADNVRSQIRSGVSQLYEYRYLQCAPDAQLVLVLQHALPPSLAWMASYLSEDRGIMLAWNGKRQPLQCHKRHRQQLRFLL